jgi:flavin reductase (DIM6/NTAB) family NADH-FMN oxidoreductase RutF
MLWTREASNPPVGPPMSADPFDRLMDRLDRPLVLVTAAARRQVAACIAAFSSQCGLVPPRYCVYLPKDHAAYEVARRAGHLMVHFLDRGDREVVHAFEDGRDEAPVDVFAALRWRRGPDGRTPRLADAEAWLFGKVVGRHDVGDHVGFVVEPIKARAPRKLRPLLAGDVTG